METKPIVSSHSSPSVVSFDEFSEDEFKADVLVLQSMLKLSSLDAIERFGRLDELVISHCPRITSLAPLSRLGSIRRLTIDRCRRIESPPDDWPATLESLLIKDTPIRELGTLPPTILGVLDVHACQSLVSVGDLSRCSSLTDLVVGPSVRDLHGIQGLNNITVHLDLSTAEPGYLPTDRTLSDALINALSCVDDLSLRIYDSTVYKALTLANPDCLSRLNNLKKLDLSACEITDPSPLLSLVNLEVLKVQPRSSLSKALGACTFSTRSQLQQAQLSILAMRLAGP
jgi:Leucine-rich repeat (LRR) protein